MEEIHVVIRPSLFILERSSWKELSSNIWPCLVPKNLWPPKDLRAPKKSPGPKKCEAWPTSGLDMAYILAQTSQSLVCKMSKAGGDNVFKNVQGSKFVVRQGPIGQASQDALWLASGTLDEINSWIAPLT